ncbi:hypothetical protein [Oscillatoria sp. HE19RPO]|uniref:hypothetical protein n=1 Tax=Oscillatoria sp. HE19RPO TaxID=2954806 RepID=UPI0020C27E0B|nr:hypothetical protein [Oscillatoria sp. HE19RPO]
MSEWIAFPFPKCPNCGKQWGKNYHRNCLFNGQLLVEPYQRQVKCEFCIEQWHILNSKFYCSCGYQFYSSEVEDALSTNQLLRQRLMKKLEEMDFYEKSMISKSTNSFEDWIYGISYEIGNLLGTTVSKAQELIKNFFDKWSF